MTELLIYRSSGLTRLRPDHTVRHPLDESKTLTTVRLPKTQLFDVGKHNGVKFSFEDIQRIVEDSNEVHRWLKPVVKLGHDSPLNDDLGDGAPAFGRLGRFSLDGTRVAVDGIERVPVTLATLITLGAYERVSVEMYRDWRAPNGKRYPYVIYAVAFLGAQMPAVKTLDDIPRLYEASEEIEGISEVFSGEWSVTFADQEGSRDQEDDSMKRPWTMPGLRDRHEDGKGGTGGTVAVEVFNETKAAADKATAEATEAKERAEKAELEAKEYREKLDAEKKERDEAEAKRVTEEARKAARAFCDDHKTRLKPAYRPAIEAALFAMATGAKPDEKVTVALTFKDDGTPDRTSDVVPMEELKKALTAIFKELPELDETDKASAKFDDSSGTDSREAAEKQAHELLVKHGYKKPVAAGGQSGGGHA